MLNHGRGLYSICACLEQNVPRSLAGAQKTPTVAFCAYVCHDGAIFPADLGWEISGQTVAAAALKVQPRFVQMFQVSVPPPALCGRVCHTGAQPSVVRRAQDTGESSAVDLH